LSLREGGGICGQGIGTRNQFQSDSLLLFHASLFLAPFDCFVEQFFFALFLFSSFILFLSSVVSESIEPSVAFADSEVESEGFIPMAPPPKSKKKRFQKSFSFQFSASRTISQYHLFPDFLFCRKNRFIDSTLDARETTLQARAKRFHALQTANVKQEVFSLFRLQFA